MRLLRLHIERNAVAYIVISEMDLLVRRSAGAHSPGNRSARITGADTDLDVGHAENASNIP